MTIGSPRNEPDGPPTSLGGTEMEGYQQQPDDTAVSGPRRSARARMSTWTLLTETLSHTRKRGGDVVSGLKGLNVR